MGRLGWALFGVVAELSGFNSEEVLCYLGCTKGHARLRHTPRSGFMPSRRVVAPARPTGPGVFVVGPERGPMEPWWRGRPPGLEASDGRRTPSTSGVPPA